MIAIDGSGGEGGGLIEVRSTRVYGEDLARSDAMAERDSATNEFLDAALGYRARGWSIIPVRPREKRPILAWQGYQQERAAEDDIRQWWRRWPDANVGIVTGGLSGLVVVDVDPAHGGTESLGHWERTHGALPHTVEARSGGGGRHLYFAHPGGMVHNRVGLLPGIDVRADGGLIVAPPSVHPSGNRYSWVVAPDHCEPAALPGALLAQLSPQGGRQGHSLAYWRTLLSEGVARGHRNDALASIAGHLLWRGVDDTVVAELMLCWNRSRCRPPLGDDEVIRTVQSIARLHGLGQGTVHSPQMSR